MPDTAVIPPTPIEAPKIESIKVPVELLHIDHSYQRKKSVIKDKFDPAIAGSILVANRDGVLYVYDGQRRLRTAERDGHDTILCTIVPSQGQAWEAEQYGRANKVKPQGAYDKYRAALCANDPEAHEMKRMAEKYGYKIQPGDNKSHIRSVSTFLSLIRMDADVLDKMLSILAGLTDRDEKHILSSKFLHGLHHFIMQYRDLPQFDYERLAERLEAVNVFKEVLDKSMAGGYAVRDVTANKIREVYNFRLQKGPKTKRLPYKE